MTECVLWRRIALVNLSRYNAADVCEREQDTERSRSLSIWCAICRKPSDVPAGAKEAGCGDEVCGEVLDAGTDGREKYRVSYDTHGCHQDEWEEAFLVTITEVCADGVYNCAPEIDWNYQILSLCGVSVLVPTRRRRS